MSLKLYDTDGNEYEAEADSLSHGWYRMDKTGRKVHVSCTGLIYAKIEAEAHSCIKEPPAEPTKIRDPAVVKAESQEQRIAALEAFVGTQNPISRALLQRMADLEAKLAALSAKIEPPVNKLKQDLIDLENAAEKFVADKGNNAPNDEFFTKLAKANAGKPWGEQP